MTSPSVELPVNMILSASRDPRVVASVESLYRDLEAESPSRDIVCRRCGQCCRFASYDHRLFVTSLELCHLIARLGPDRLPTRTSEDACPYQVVDDCSIHAHRILGCRVFDCESQGRAADTGEIWHQRMVQLHRNLAIPYRYVEWCDALRQLARAIRPPKS